MSEYQDGVPSITEPWPTRDVRLQILDMTWQVLRLHPPQIVYVAIMGTVMIAAFLEWFLWLAAFIYCLVKVFQKAEHWSVRILAIAVAFVFTCLR